MPAMGGYWLWPERMAASTAATSAGSQSKSGKPWPRLMAPDFAASADITVKIVVPTAGRRLRPTRVAGSRARPSAAAVSELIVFSLAIEDAQDQRAAEPLGQQLREGQHEGAQVGAAPEGHARDV